MIFGWVQLSHPGGASAEWGSSCWKFLPVVMEVPTLSRRHLVGIFRLKFSFRFWLIYYISDPQKYKAIVTFYWWRILTTKNTLRTTRIFYSKVRERWRIMVLVLVSCHKSCKMESDTRKISNCHIIFRLPVPCAAKQQRGGLSSLNLLKRNVIIVIWW